MLDDADLVILAAVATVLLVSWAATHRRLARDHMNSQRYRIFRVRDELIYLVAAEKLSESDVVFRTFYESSNHLINRTKVITLDRFVAALRAVREHGMDPAETKKLDEISMSLKTNGPDVQVVVHQYYIAVTSILVENSVLLSWMSRYGLVDRVVQELRTLGDRATKRSATRQAYRYYRDYSRAAHATA